MTLSKHSKLRVRGARRTWSMAIVLAGATFSAVAADPTAEVVYRQGTVYTVDQRGTVAQALAVAGGKIVYVGTDAGASALVGKDAKVIDLAGRTLMPGLIDGHMHPVAAGIDLLKCNMNYLSLTASQFKARLQGCLDERRKTDGPDSWLEVVNWFRYGMGAAASGVDRKLLDSLKSAPSLFMTPLAIRAWSTPERWPWRRSRRRPKIPLAVGSRVTPRGSPPAFWRMPRNYP
jgi:hypothetical protein